MLLMDTKHEAKMQKLWTIFSTYLVLRLNLKKDIEDENSNVDSYATLEEANQELEVTSQEPKNHNQELVKSQEDREP